LRLFLLALVLTLTIAAPSLPAQETKLPDIGSSAGELLTPARQREYGAMMLRELRNYGYVMEDPLLEEWIQTFGDRLVSNSDLPQQSFTFFLMHDRQINAFATLGGYIGVNAGLILAADREDEVASVLSHEIAHVTQQHVLRAVERAQRDQIPILLGMLAAIVAAQSAGGNSSGDATQIAIVGAMGLMQQNQINYTRAAESEADRIGIRTLARSGYDIDAMAGFFERMAFASRGNQGGYSAPDYLRTHPVTTTRISEARQRADQIRKSATSTITPTTAHRTEQGAPVFAANNPLLPPSLQFDSVDTLPQRDAHQFDWAKERLRALSASTPEAAIREYEALRRSRPGGLSDAQQYGLALVKMHNNATAAIADLSILAQAHPDNLWVNLALAQAESQAGRSDIANQRFDALLKRMPNHRAVILTYAAALNEQGNQQSGQRAQQLLRPLLIGSGDDPVFQQTFARACELAGDSARASEAYAEAAFLNGRPEQALMQLQNLKKRDDLDYITRSRVDARIAAITPLVLELRSQGIREQRARLY
jgi:predicted Zn-dependent protease